LAGMGAAPPENARWHAPRYLHAEEDRPSPKFELTFRRWVRPRAAFAIRRWKESRSAVREENVAHPQSKSFEAGRFWKTPLPPHVRNTSSPRAAQGKP